jgi:TfoX/Sxy family transcriptional regulator of competence genes
VKIPKPDKVPVDLFRSLVPDHPDVTVRPMFGNISAFVNGNMFFGVFGNDLFVRLSAEDQAELLKKKGASNLEPMKGRPMKDYIIMPQAWKNETQTMRGWIFKSLDWSAKLPPKKKSK